MNPNEILAGEQLEKEVDTAAAPQLNNATVPTREQEENANLLIEQEVREEEPLSEPAPEQEVLDTDQQEQEILENPEVPDDDVPGVEEAAATRTFTQSQVDEIAGKIRKETREKVTRDLFGRYGVNTVEELDDLFGDAQRFAITQDERESEKKAWEEADCARNAELCALKESIALLESGIDKNRYEDAKFILKGKGLDVTSENIEHELATHPEWKSVQAPVQAPTPEFPFKKKAAPTQIVVPTLGNEGEVKENPELTERERALKMFKV